MKDQILTMLEMQDAMNTKVHAHWREQNFEWYRAIWVECAELMDHYGWKWWKKQSPDVEQVNLELIDIWHFGLSILLINSSDSALTAENIQSLIDFPTDKPDFKNELESFTEATLRTRDFDVAGFARLMSSVGLSFDDLYRRYVGKNVLNFFRQDNGYKEGHYRKLWAGKEDNEHLVDVLNQLDSTSPSFREDVYSHLSERYELQEA